MANDVLQGMTAAIDLRAQQYHFVGLSAARTVNISSLATSSVGAGVLVNRPNSGQNASVHYTGEVYITGGASYSANALLTTNGSGRAVAAASGDWCYGRAIEAAGANGDVVKMLAYPPFRISGAV